MLFVRSLITAFCRRVEKKQVNAILDQDTLFKKENEFEKMCRDWEALYPDNPVEIRCLCRRHSGKTTGEVVARKAIAPSLH